MKSIRLDSRNGKLIFNLSLWIALAFAGSLSAFSADTAMFRGNPAHTGVYDAAGVPKLNGAKWTFNSGGQIYASPAAADGMIFIGNNAGRLFALDQETGAEKWKFPAHNRIASSPAVSNGFVYFNCYDSNFYAVDEFTGQLKWKFATGGEKRFAAQNIHGAEPANESMPDPFDFYLSSPSIANGIVYFGSGDDNVYALDAATGALKWKFHTDNVVHASPAISDGVLYIGSWDTYFYALNATTGKQLWKFKTGEDVKIHNQTGIQSSASVANGIVYFGCRDSNLYALDAHTGAKKWAFYNKTSWVIGTPAVRDGKVYFATSEPAWLHVVDANSGTEIFSLNLHWPAFSSPTIAGNFLYIGTHEGKFYAIDLTSQKIAWTFQTAGSKKNGAEFTDKDGEPDYAVAMPTPFYDDIVTGVQKMFSVGAIISSPVIVNDTIYFGSTDGNLYAIH